MEKPSDPESIAPESAIQPEEPERILSGQYRERRTEAEIVRDLEEISSLYLRGKKPSEIAEELIKRHHYTGMSIITIKDQLAALRKMWVNSALINYDEAKAREIAHVDELEAAAWDAWNRSWAKTTTVVQEGIEDRFGHKSDSPEQMAKKPTTYMRKRGTSTTKERLGDPRYLDRIAWCIDRRCRILGLDEPTRLAISWQQEAAKAGVSEDDARAMYKMMEETVTKKLRDKYLAENQIQIPADVLDAEYEEDGDLPDGIED